MEIYEILKKLIGEIEPCGDSAIDEQRKRNLLVFIDVLDQMLAELNKITEYGDSPEFSMKNIGEIARDKLREIKNEDEFEQDYYDYDDQLPCGFCSCCRCSCDD